MIVGNQTKLYYKKKAWLTPRHPFYFEKSEFKVHYVAVLWFHATKNQKRKPEDNFELNRLICQGLELTKQQLQAAKELSKDISGLMEYFDRAMTGMEKRCYLVLDLLNISGTEESVSSLEMEYVHMFVRMLGIPETYYHLCQSFIKAAKEEKREYCRKLCQQMEQEKLKLSQNELKYYLMSLQDTFSCTQELLEKEREVRLVDRCEIREDLALTAGMRLIFDHAVVRIYGNIALEGGELLVENSRIIRKSNSHRACINIHYQGKVVVKSSDVDCRNMGMFIRGQEGSVKIFQSEIYHTTRGAAIRFWGDELEVRECYFHHCYSSEDGGAIMTRKGEKIRIEDCRFRHCEAGKGGAIFGYRPMKVKNCVFEKCYALKYGAAIFYMGAVGGNLKDLSYRQCFPSEAETIQYLAAPDGIDISGEQMINISTLLDCPLDITPKGSLKIQNATLYLRHSIRNRGSLELDKVNIYCEDMEQRDMLVLDHGRSCVLKDCRLDGMGKHGGIFDSITRIEAENCIFCNMKGGRAIFNASSLKLKGCIFNYCLDGGVHTISGHIENCQFVNCRESNGAGIIMLGKRGIIRECQFIRCVSDLGGGAVDLAVGNTMTCCDFTECR